MGENTHHSLYLKQLFEIFEALREGASEAEAERAVGQVKDGSEELDKSQSMQDPESQLQVMYLYAVRAKRIH